LRSGDYFGLFLRLLIIGGVLLLLLPVGYATYFAPLFVLYLTAFQLVPMWRHHYNKLWLSIYPVKEEERSRAFLRMMTGILVVQSVILSILVAFVASWTEVGIVLAGGLLFAYVYVNTVVKKRIAKL
jgi:ABC-2 type transport system permease protein